MSKRFYSDAEIIDLVENIGDSTNSYIWVADLVRERFTQKDNQRDFLQHRLRVAESALGAMYLQELIDGDVY